MIRLQSSLALSLLLGACGGAAATQTTATAEPCHGDCDHHEGGEQTAAGPTVAPGEAHVGDTTTCPVSGERFVVTDQSPHADFEGHTYYFCCPGCIDRFQASPAQYAHPVASAAVPANG